MPVVDANVWVAAYDHTDRFHDASGAFLEDLESRSLAVRAPAIVLVEVGCALARRFRDPSVGQSAASLMAEPGLLRLEPLTESLLSEALRLGTERRLRAADALYAATAFMIPGSHLVSWDTELLDRSEAITPAQWLEGER